MEHLTTSLRFTPAAMVLVAGVALAAVPAGMAQKELANAKMHATVASQIDSLAGIHLHLHHVINCLVGPHGAGYSAKAETLSTYHCNDLGAGAIADSAGNQKAQRLEESALREAEAGVHATSYAIAKHDANHVLRIINSARRSELK